MSQIDFKDVLKQFSAHENDTGSSEVQVITLTERISSLSEHLNFHRKDFHSRRGLLQMVSKRRSLLAFLKRKNAQRYADLIKALGLRR